MSMSVADLVTHARSRIRETTAQEFRAQPPVGVLIDVREPAEFEAGHLAGAINIPRGLLEFQVDGHPAVASAGNAASPHKSQPVVVYCRTGGRSALAALSLQQMGFTDVCSIAGGIAEWTAAGLPVIHT
jgi:rhodanese-related sulfurtransferase